MDAKVIDTRDGSTVCTYLDWYWAPHIVKNPERFGHVRAQESAASLNEREANDRFRAVRVGPKIKARVKVRAYGHVRSGQITERRIRNGRIETRVLWHNKKGRPHEHWYFIGDLRFAGTSPHVLTAEALA